MRTASPASVLLLALALASLIPLAACSVGPGADEGASSDLTINPTGGEAAGKLLVIAPNDIGSAKIFAQRSLNGGTGALLELTPNVSQVVPTGNYCIWTRVDGIDTLPHCEAVNPGTSTMNVLGAVKLTRSTQDLVFGVDWPAGTKLGQLVGRPEAIPHASGTVALGIDPMRVTFDVAPDSVTTIDVAGADKPALRIVGSREHALPNPLLGMDAASCPQAAPGGPRPPPCKVGDFTYALRVLRALQGVPEIVSSARLEDLVAGGKALLLRADQPTTLTLSYQKCINGVDDAHKTCFGTPHRDVEMATEANAPATVVQLGRLEVPKIEFTKLDGTIVTVDGEFDVSVGDTLLFERLPLGTGVDVLPSAAVGQPYTVVRRYKSPNDGAPIVLTQEAIVEP